MLINTSKHDKTTNDECVFLVNAGCVQFKQLPDIQMEPPRLPVRSALAYQLQAWRCAFTGNKTGVIVQDVDWSFVSHILQTSFDRKF